MPVAPLLRGHIAFKLIVKLKEPAEAPSLNDEIVERGKDSYFSGLHVLRYVIQRFHQRVSGLVQIPNLHRNYAASFNRMRQPLADSRGYSAVPQVSKLWFSSHA